MRQSKGRTWGPNKKCIWANARYYAGVPADKLRFFENSNQSPELGQGFAKNFDSKIHLCRGGISIGVNVVDKIITLEQKESVRLDPDRLNSLYHQLGDSNAMDVLCRTIEELALRLSNCERF